MWTLLRREDTVTSPNENIYALGQKYIYLIIYTYIYITSNSSCIYKVQILIVGRVTRVYTKKHEYTHVSIFQIILCLI